MKTTSQKPLELWGGVECTINRVGEQYFSQLVRNGHRARLDDLDRFAELGLRTLRFPILWEELAPDSPEDIDWSLVDAPLERLRALGIRPIAGLVHHGSGPRYTSLIDPRFPEKLADFARRVAERYPEIGSYTPVNEPLTTARFSGLYGHWFPHGRDGFTFVRALFNQLRGVVLAMRAVRSINPAAALVQTDDLGKTFSSPRLQYQADFENERRWLSWDLLCGRVDREHPMWHYLVWAGAEESEIEFFAENPCPPDVIGANHYVTSERFLDENLRNYSPEMHGGNGRDRYADVAAVRARPEGGEGVEKLLREMLDRYELPVAVTEAHLGCTREEQLRWLDEIWTAAQRLHREGRDLRAVTAWSLLGAFDWDGLLTHDRGCYEPGAFDLRGGTPRETAVGKMIRSLAQRGSFEHPILLQPGWWRRDGVINSNARPILITGGAGNFAQAFLRAAEGRGLRCVALSHAALDIVDPDAIQRAIATHRPWALINCAAFTDVEQAEGAEDRCTAINVGGTENLARACAAAAIPFVTFSSDHIFDGGKSAPYLESDRGHALSVYGRSKMAADELALRWEKSLVIRPGKILAPLAASDAFLESLRVLARGGEVRVANDLQHSVTFLPDLVHAVLDLLIDGETGLWHLAHDSAVTPEQLLVRLAGILQLDAALVVGVPSWSLRRPAPRARMQVLQTERAPLLGSLDDALGRYCRELPALVEELEPAAGDR